jgi:hypothetical protein
MKIKCLFAIFDLLPFFLFRPDSETLAIGYIFGLNTLMILWLVLSPKRIRLIYDCSYE